jgi:hypothetical protein
VGTPTIGPSKVLTVRDGRIVALYDFRNPPEAMFVAGRP